MVYYGVFVETVLKSVSGRREGRQVVADGRLSRNSAFDWWCSTQPPLSVLVLRGKTLDLDPRL